MTLRSKRKIEEDEVGEKYMGSRQSTVAKQLAMPALEMAFNYMCTVSLEKAMLSVPSI